MWVDCTICTPAICTIYQAPEAAARAVVHEAPTSLNLLASCSRDGEHTHEHTLPPRATEDVHHDAAHVARLDRRGLAIGARVCARAVPGEQGRRPDDRNNLALLRAALGDDFMGATWDDVKVAVEISAYSLKTLAEVAAPLMTNGGSIVGLDFDATVAWPAYNWMGFAKAALESANRYLARELGPQGIRVNLVAAGPIKTMAAKSIPGFTQFEDVWDDRAPLGWNVEDPSAVARSTVALLSDWFPATTGSMIHVDGGFHAMGV